MPISWLKSYGKCQFSIGDPNLGNRLLANMRNLSCLENFKSVQNLTSSRLLSQIKNDYHLNILLYFTDILFGAIQRFCLPPVSKFALVNIHY